MGKYNTNLTPATGMPQFGRMASRRRMKRKRYVFVVCACVVFGVRNFVRLPLDLELLELALVN